MNSVDKYATTQLDGPQYRADQLRQYLKNPERFETRVDIDPFVNCFVIKTKPAFAVYFKMDEMICMDKVNETVKREIEYLEEQQ